MRRAALGMPAIDVGQQVQAPALLLAGLPLGWLQIQHGRSAGAQQCALVVGRQKPVRPIPRSALRKRQLGHHHIAGNVLIETAQPVGHPRSDTRVCPQRAAGVEVEESVRVIHRLGLAAPVNTQLVGDVRIRHVHEAVAHFDAGLADLPKTERASDVVGLGSEFDQHLVRIADRLRQVQVPQLGLRVERVHVPRPALQNQEDAGLGLGGQHRLFGGQRPCRRSGLPCKQAGEGQRPCRRPQPEEQFPPSQPHVLAAISQCELAAPGCHGPSRHTRTHCY